MKTFDVAVVGQGISGILLTRRLQRAGKAVIAFDDANPAAASNHAAAILNPVNLGKLAPAMYPEEMDAALEAYNDLSIVLHQEVCAPLNLYAYLDASVIVPATLENRLLPASKTTSEALHRFFYLPEKTTVYTLSTWKINYPLLKQAWLKHLEHSGFLHQERFIYNDLTPQTGGYVYNDLCFRQLVFCEGLDARQNPYFPLVNFTRNRGDYLLLYIPDLPAEAIYHYGLRLVPQGSGIFWYGSNYRWDYSDLQSDLQWKARALDKLNYWLKVPFNVLEHQVAERPTRPGQVPVLSQHPDHNGMYLFNGMGTKGFTLGPYRAASMTRFMLAAMT